MINWLIDHFEKFTDLLDLANYVFGNFNEVKLVAESLNSASWRVFLESFESLLTLRSWKVCALHFLEELECLLKIRLLKNWKQVLLLHVINEYHDDRVPFVNYGLLVIILPQVQLVDIIYPLFQNDRDRVELRTDRAINLKEDAFKYLGMIARCKLNLGSLSPHGILLHRT